MEVTIDAKIGGTIQVKGTTDPVSGLVDGSLVITCDAFIEKRIFMMKNGFHLPLYNGHTKFVLDNFISLNVALLNDDIVYIETISI